MKHASARPHVLKLPEHEAATMMHHSGPFVNARACVCRSSASRAREQSFDRQVSTCYHSLVPVHATQRARDGSAHDLGKHLPSGYLALGVLLVATLLSLKHRAWNKTRERQMFFDIFLRRRIGMVVLLNSLGNFMRAGLRAVRANAPVRALPPRAATS